MPPETKIVVLLLNEAAVRVVVTIGIALVALLVTVLAAKWLRTLPAVEVFLVEYPGQVEVAAAAPTGLPTWLGWQHFLNAFFMVLIIRLGWHVRTSGRPKAYWTETTRDCSERRTR